MHDALPGPACPFSWMAADLLADIPPADRLVVCHGDACAPNTLIAEDGHWSGHVDLGELGVADRFILTFLAPLIRLCTSHGFDEHLSLW